jgi:hypothetical protein
MRRHTSAFVSHRRLADELDPDATAFLAPPLPVDEPVRLHIFRLADRIAAGQGDGTGN